MMNCLVMYNWEVLLLALGFLNTPSSASDDINKVVRGVDSCKKSLFSEEENVTFSASSVFGDLKDFQPEKARMLQFWQAESGKDQGHAWCPRTQIKTETKEWIEVEFESLKVIKLIFMMGRGEGNYKEYVPFFLLRYQRDANGPWYDYHDLERKKILTGNVDPRNVQRVILSPMIVAKKVRIYPYQEKVGRQMCLRLSLYGCNFDDGVIEYQIPQGQTLHLNGNDEPLNLIDDSYDGPIPNSGVGPSSAPTYLTNGMGQLMDNIAFMQKPDDDINTVPGKPGYHFVGWKRSNRDPNAAVSLLFKFDHVRNFSSVRLHAYNSMSQRITVFSQAKAEFSIGGRIFDQQQDPVVLKFRRDSRLQNTRWVTLGLKQRIGRFIRLTLNFDMDWILLTEVQFFSKIVTHSVPIESAKFPINRLVSTASPISPNRKYPHSGDADSKSSEGGVLPTDKTSGGGAGSASPLKPFQFDHVLAIVGTLSLLLLCLILVSFLVWRWRRSQRQKKKSKMMGTVGGGGSGMAVQCTGMGLSAGMMAGTPGDGDQNNCYAFEHYVSPMNHVLGVRGPNGSSAHQPLLKDSSLYTNVPTDEDDEDCLMGLVTGVNRLGQHHDGSCPVSGNSVLPYAAYSVKPHMRHSPENFGMGTEYASTTLFSSSPPAYHPGLQQHNGLPGIFYQSTGHQLMAGGSCLSTPLHSAASPGVGMPLQIIANPMAEMMDPQQQHGAVARGCYASPQQPGVTMPTGLTVQIPPPPMGAQVSMMQPPPLPPPRQPAEINIQGFSPNFWDSSLAPSSFTSRSGVSPISRLTGTTVYAWPQASSAMTSSATTTNTNSPGPPQQQPTGSSPLPPLPEISLSRLRLVERLGGGQYGEVHLAEVLGDAGLPGDSPPVPDVTVSIRPRLVAVKMLRKDSSDQAKREFQQEISILSRLCDPNLAGVLGVCTEQGSLSAIVEYTKHGDLHQFLRSRRPTTTISNYGCPVGTVSPNSTAGNITVSGSDQVMRTSGMDMESSDTLSYGCLIYLAAQVASGMKYLESLGLVHRDLACRNCLVGSRFAVKISDLGMCRRVNATDYCRLQGRPPLPIRWMAWETLLQGKFSCKSDVWSFAVTLWEILTFCRQQPLDHLTNEQVVDNSVRVGAEDPSAEYPPCPALCPKEIYDLMLECWQMREAQRPAFREIHMFLQRKNLGFDAEDEYQVSRASSNSSGNALA